MPRLLDRLGRRAGGGIVPGQTFASVFNQRLAGGGAKLPKVVVGDAANILLQVFRRPQPAVFSTGLRPKIVGGRRVPGRHVNSVGHMADGHFVLRPVRKKRLKEMPADFPMQAAHAIHRPAAADRQIGHVETFGRVVRILAAQGQQIVEGNAEFLLRITAEVLFDESRSETVKAGGHRRVGGKKIPRPRGGQRDFKGLRVLLHETAGAFQDREGRMTFIQVTDIRLDAERARATASRQSPAAFPA